MDFVKYAIVDPKQRDAEYQWLHDAIMTNILLRVDGIESQGNATIQVKRKSLIYQANMMLNRLVLAKRRFDKQEKGRERVEPGEASSRPLFQERTLRERERERRRADSENQSIIAEAGHPISVKHKGKHRTPMIESSPETSDDDVVYARARRYTDNVGNAIRYLQASTARTPPATSRPEGLIPNGPNLDEANDSTSPLGRSRAGQRPSTPSPDERLPTPRYNRGPSTPSPDERRPTPRYNRGPSTPLFNERPSTPSPDERLPTPRFNRGPSTPLLNERPSTPSADERRPTPRFNRGPSTPLFNERPSTPLFNELSTSSFSETSSPSISSLDAVYEPTRPRRVYSRRVPTDSSTGNRAYSPPYTSVGEYAHSSTLKPPAAILGITGKEPGPPLSRSSVLEWLSGVDVNRRDNGSPN
ncbi:hypothetical protein F4802DRAFT_443307 [Xylaria palmicola]|nr:hypothetical protein F4802DRAFT_443307 [Xylaria palmicola]